MTFLLAALLAVSAALSTAQADPPAPAPILQAYAAGETLDYTVNWMKIAGGTARMTIAPEGDGKWRITSVAKSGGGLARFIKVRDEI